MIPLETLHTDPTLSFLTHNLAYFIGLWVFLAPLWVNDDRIMFAFGKIVVGVVTPLLIVGGGTYFVHWYGGDVDYIRTETYRVEMRCYGGVFGENFCRIIPMQPHHYDPNWDGAISFGAVNTVEKWEVSASEINCMKFLDNGGERKLLTYVYGVPVPIEDCADHEGYPENRIWGRPFLERLPTALFWTAITALIYWLVSRRKNKIEQIDGLSEYNHLEQPKNTSKDELI